MRTENDLNISEVENEHQQTRITMKFCNKSNTRAPKHTSKRSNGGFDQQKYDVIIAYCKRDKRFLSFRAQQFSKQKSFEKKKNEESKFKIQPKSLAKKFVSESKDLFPA